MKKKILFLVSGNGGNLKFFHHYLKALTETNVQLFCISDRECGALEYCQKNSIESYQIKYNQTSPFTLRKILEQVSPDLIITNWHKIIDPITVDMYRGKLLNLHYSLLPSFGGVIGLVPVDKAYKNECKFTGVTCHFVDEGVDTGKILSQGIFKTNIPLEDAYEKTFRAGCIILLDTVLRKIGEACEFNFENFHKISFSPSIGFNLNIIDEIFWIKINNA